MSIPILNELQSELERLYTAGSQLAKDDPRIKKYIQPLQALGQRAPVFSSLASSLEDLAAGDESSSPEKLLEAGSLLYAVQYTQGETSMEGNWEDLPDDIPFLEQRRIPYSQLSVTVGLLSGNNRAPASELAALTESGDFRDPRLYPYFAAAAGSAADSSDFYIETKIIPMIGKDMIPYLLGQLDMEGTKADAVRFSLLCSLAGPDSLELTLRALECEPGGPVYLRAVRNLRYFPQQEQTLTELTQIRKKPVREEAFSSLAFMNTPAGNALIREKLISGNADDISEALALSSDIQTVQLMHEQAEQCLADIKNSSKKLKNLCQAFVQRDEDKGFELLFYVLSKYAKDDEVSSLLDFNRLISLLRQSAGRRRVSELLWRLGSTSPGYISLKVYAAPFLFSAQDVYSECRGLISADYNLRRELAASYGLYGSLRPSVSDKERRWDERWSKLFYKKDDFIYAYIFVFDSDISGWTGLLDHAAAKIRKNPLLYNSVYYQALADAFRLNHPKAQKYYDKFIKAGTQKSRLDKYLNTDSN